MKFAEVHGDGDWRAWRGTAITARHAIPFGPFLVIGFIGVVAGTLV